VPSVEGCAPRSAFQVEFAHRAIARIRDESALSIGCDRHAHRFLTDVDLGDPPHGRVRRGEQTDRVVVGIAIQQQLAIRTVRDGDWIVSVARRAPEPPPEGSHRWVQRNGEQT
jgi:hypothetical protein